MSIMTYMVILDDCISTL